MCTPSGVHLMGIILIPRPHGCQTQTPAIIDYTRYLYQSIYIFNFDMNSEKTK